MSEIIKLKIDVTKIDKNLLFRGQKGTYLDVALLANREGEDQYGNHYMVVQDVGKEARQRGEKGPILGNAKVIKGTPPGQSRQEPSQYDDRFPQGDGSQEIDDDDLPF